ncbi:hypothetical protein EOD39_8585 [Acipenser ruthenus]|uniref:Uncharacterized protein n=1 Tax=Acipenser ruthenus TaxID=7906 RepID=A0A444U395_ACIRT|nr:hypothetical protein EOD39_8585 [Acipenser ruthenus]
MVANTNRARAGSSVGVPRRSWSLDAAPGSRSPHKPRLASSTRAKENIQTVSTKPQEPILIGDPPGNVLKGRHKRRDEETAHYARQRGNPIMVFIATARQTEELFGNSKVPVDLDVELLKYKLFCNIAYITTTLNGLSDVANGMLSLQPIIRSEQVNEEIEQIDSRGQTAYNKILSLKEEIKKLQKKLSNLDKVDGEAFIQQYEEEYGEESEEKRKGNNQEDQEEAEQKEEKMEAKNPSREVKRKQAPKGTNTKEDK